MRDWVSILFSKFDLHDGHLISFLSIKSSIFLLSQASADMSNFSSTILSARKIALHFEHFIVRSLKVLRWPDASHTVSGITVGPSISLSPLELNIFLTEFSTLFFRSLPSGP